MSQYDKYKEKHKNCNVSSKQLFKQFKNVSICEDCGN